MRVSRRVLKLSTSQSRNLSRISARAQLETAAGVAATGILCALSVGGFAYVVISDTPVSAIVTANALSLGSLLHSGGWRSAFVSPFLHTDIVQALAGVAATAVAGTAAALAPTYLFRGIAIPSVFLLAAVAGGLTRIEPDAVAAAEAADAASNILPSDRLDAVVSRANATLRADFSVTAYAAALRAVISRSIDDLIRHPLIVAGSKAQSWGAFDGATGLITFACLEWGLGSRTRLALLVPAGIVLQSGAAYARLPPGVGGYQPRPSIRRSAAVWPTDYDARTAALATLVAAGMGALCWGLGRSARLSLHVGRLLLNTTRRGGSGGSTTTTTSRLY